MTLEELNRYKVLKIRVKKYNDELETLETLREEIKVDADLDNEIHNLKELLKQNKIELIQELSHLIGYIESIADEETQGIFISRFIEGKTLEQIGDELFLHSSTVFYRIKNQIE